MDKTRLISFCGKVPLLGASLRQVARRYQEGSVVTIRNGHLAGYKWNRSHRYVNGYWLGIYELQIQECLVHELKLGNIFYDIGANAGFFTLLASKCVGPEGRVFAFEPLPENIKTIRSQSELNQISNCTLVDVAVSDQIGEIELFEGEDTSTASITPRVESQGNTHLVRTITLDEFVRTAPSPDIIKIDIEGAEIRALQGSLGLLGSKRSPKILIEFHGDDIAERSMSLLRDLGYTLWHLNGQPIDSVSIPHHLLATPPDYHDH